MLEIQRITKRFGALRANHCVSLSLGAGEIHALLGENGAGKSTLVKILYGALQPDEGQIIFQGRTVHLDSPAAARQLGIGMVFQHFSLFDALNVAENIALALPGNPSLDKINGDLARLSQDYGLPLDPAASVHDLSVGERQRVEIVRCLLAQPKLIIMDEPTSVLTPQEADRLFITLRRLCDEGRSILYISHKLEEVCTLCDRATILRQGARVASCHLKETSKAELARLMVGEAVTPVQGPDITKSKTKMALQVTQLSQPTPHQFGTALHEISFSLKTGQINAIAGIAGNGQSELFSILSGETRSKEANTVQIFGEAAGQLAINERRKKGLAFVVEDRLGHGVAPGMTMSDNVVLTRAATSETLLTFLGLKWRYAHKLREKICIEFGVRRGEKNPPVQALSGGNLQKFIMGRELDSEPKIMIINQPSWGVDQAAAARIRHTLIEKAKAGMAVLIISQDLDEIFEMADEIAVLYEGRLSPFQTVSKLCREDIGLLMGGEGFANEDCNATSNSRFRRP